MRRKLTVAGLLAVSVVVVVWLFLPPEAKARILAYTDIAQTISGAWTFIAPQTFAPTSSVAVPGTSGGGGYFKSDAQVAGMTPRIERFNIAPGTAANAMSFLGRSNTPSVGDGIFSTWELLDSGSNFFAAASLRAVATDVTDGSEDAYMSLRTMAGGTEAERMRLDATGLMGPAGGVLALPAGATIAAPIVSGAAPSYNEIIVDPAGVAGAYTSIQAAINYVQPISTVADPWTIRLLPGVYESNTQIDATDLTGVRFIGAGRNATIVKMPLAGTGHLIDVSNSTDVLFANLTLKQENATAGSFVVNADDIDGLVFDSCRLEGNTNAVIESLNAAVGGSLTFYNCELIGSFGGGTADTVIISGVNLLAIGTIFQFTHTGNIAADTVRFQRGDARFIGCDLILTPEATLTSTGNAALNFGSTGSPTSAELIGTRVVADISNGDMNNASAVLSAISTISGGSGGASLDLRLVGSHVGYKTGTITSAGIVCGVKVGAPAANATIGSIFLDGTSVEDLGGSGGTVRNDVIIDTSVVGATRIIKELRQSGSRFKWGYRVIGGSPTVIHANYGTTPNTGNRQSGSATFASAGTVSVTLPVAYSSSPSQVADYAVSVEGTANETYWITAKTNAGFTINSSNSASTATVIWVITR